MKILLGIFITIFLLNLVSAELIMSPNPLNVNTKINEEETFTLTLQNTFDFIIEDFSFKNLSGFIFPNIILQPNETKNIEIKVNRPDNIFTTIISKVSFNYLVDIPSETKTHKINITGSGFKPEFLTIHQGDTITWTNMDDIKHTVTSSTFDHDIETGNVVSIVFDQLGEINYQDLILFYPGVITVLDRLSPQKVHNPSFDRDLIVDLNVIIDPTQLEIESLGNNFTVSTIGTTEGSVRIKNIGNETAQRIELSSSSNWIEFLEQDFDLEKDQQNFVDYKISPLIFSSNETNKTYSIDIKIKGSNTEEKNFTIQVFIPFSIVSDDFNTNEGFVSWFTNVYCPKNPQILFCNNTIQSGGETKIIIRDPEIPINLTTTEVFAMLKRIQRIEDSNQRTNNQINSLLDQISSTNPQLLKLLNESVTQQSENERVIKRDKNVRWIFGFFIFTSILILIMAFMVRKYRTKRKIMGGYT